MLAFPFARRGLLCVVALALQAAWPASTLAQVFPNNNFNNFNNFNRNFNNGLNGLNSLNGLNGLGSGIGQQLPPPILRNNWYMYNSVGGMGTTGGTIQVVTQFGAASQSNLNNFGGGLNSGFGAPGSGFGRSPAFFGAHYQRQLLAAQLAYRQAAALSAAGYYAPAGQAYLGTGRTFQGFSLAPPASRAGFLTGVNKDQRTDFNSSGFDKETTSSSERN